MGDAIAIPLHAAQTAPPSTFRLKPFLIRSIMLGVLIALFSGPFLVNVLGLLSLASPDMPLMLELNAPPSVDPATTSIALIVFLMLVWAPLAESLFFPLLYWITRWLPAHRAIFAVLIGVLAYVAHGATVANVIQAAGFMLMGLWYAHLRERYPSPFWLSPAKIPYYGIVIAHFAWNATAILWPLAISSLIRLMGAR